MSTVQKTRPFHPTEGWNEKRTHPDGVSYWRRGELHRARGWAVMRFGIREAWLFGKQIPTPSHNPTTPLTFDGQSKTGRLTWVDDEGAIRISHLIQANGIEETRWYDTTGNPEEHWSGNYHVRRLLPTGESRYYRQATPESRALLHRVDGPAIQDAESEARSKWLIDGDMVTGPIELLIKHTMRAEQAARHGRPIVRLPLTDEEKGRLRITVMNHPDTPLASDIAMCFPDEYREAIAAMGLLYRDDGGRP